VKGSPRKVCSVETEMLSWTEFGHAAPAMAHTAHDDGTRPDRILAIARRAPERGNRAARPVAPCQLAEGVHSKGFAWAAAVSGGMGLAGGCL
jgi:hypothetical protein